MGEIFEALLNMSITGSVVIAVIILVRFFLKGMPKRYSYALWSVAGFRLCCPVSFKSIVSIFNLNPIQKSSEIVTDHGTMNYTGTPAVITPEVSPVEPAEVIGGANEVSEAVAASSLLDNFVDFIPYLWLAGAVLLLAYGVFAFVKLRKSLATAVKYEEGIYQSEAISTPFILGIIKPRIYIPYGVENEYLKYVIEHEKYHLKRFDNVIKAFAFCVLALHWFNPLCWIAFVLMNRDMEMSCDEWVLSHNENIKKQYSTALLSFAADRHFPSPSPLCFGEGSAKSRIKNVLKFKKPTAVISVIAVVVCAAIAVVCIANPKADNSAAVNASYMPTSAPTKTGDTGEGKFTYYAEEGCLIIDAYNKFLPAFASFKEYDTDCGYTFDDSDELLTPEEIESVKSVVINDGVTMIYHDPFRYFENLEEVTLPKSIKRILSATFDSSEKLKVINYGGSKEDWNKIKIDRCNDCLNNVKINYNVKIDKSSFKKSEDVESETKIISNNINVTLNYYTGVVSIEGEGSLYMSQEECDTVAMDIDSLFLICPVGSDGCVARFVDEIIVGEGITSIEKGVFKSTSASAVTLPKSLKAIKGGAFAPYWDNENKAYKLNTVKYAGNGEEWERISIANEDNENLLNATEMIYQSIPPINYYENEAAADNFKNMAEHSKRNDYSDVISDVSSGNTANKYYKALMEDKENTIQYIFSEFCRGRQVNAKGTLMRLVMDDIIGDEAISGDYETGQEYFDVWAEHYIQLSREKGNDYIKSKYPYAYIYLTKYGDNAVNKEPAEYIDFNAYSNYEQEIKHHMTTFRYSDYDGKHKAKVRWRQNYFDPQATSAELVIEHGGKEVYNKPLQIKDVRPFSYNNDVWDYIIEVDPKATAIINTSLSSAPVLYVRIIDSNNTEYKIKMWKESEEDYGIAPVYINDNHIE